MRTLLRWLVIVILILMAVFLLVVGPRSRAHPAALVSTTTPFDLATTPFALQQTVVSPTPGMGTAAPIIPQTGGTALPSSASVPSALSSLVQIRDQICVRKVPYTILSLPSAATFEVIPAPGQDPTQLVCNNVLTIGDTRTVVCSGQQSATITLRVTNNGFAEDVIIPLRSCASSGNTDPGSGPVVQPTDSASTPLPLQTETLPAPTEPPTETLPAPTP